MSINFNPGMNPEEYAKRYATNNNISIQDARETLRSQYGDPNPNNISIFSSQETDTFTFSGQKDMDDNLFFEQDNSEGGFNILETILNFLKELGANNQMNSQGNEGRQNPDEYAKKYAKENGITLEEAKVELENKYGEPTFN